MPKCDFNKVCNFIEITLLDGWFCSLKFGASNLYGLLDSSMFHMIFDLVFQPVLA